MKKLKKYLSPSIIPLILGILIPVGGTVAAWFIVKKPKAALYSGLLFLIVGLCFIIPYVLKVLRLNKQLKALDKAGVMDQVLAEFDAAEVHFKGKLRLGQTWAFGKGCYYVYPYSKMEYIYEYIQVTNGTETSRELRVDMPKDDACTLCPLPAKGKGNDEAKQVVAFVREKNPACVIGHRPPEKPKEKKK